MKQEKYNALISFLMIVVAVLFLLYMGSSLVRSTHKLKTTRIVNQDFSMNTNPLVAELQKTVSGFTKTCIVL